MSAAVPARPLRAMVGAGLYLALMSNWNAIVNGIKRLRQPKYLVGAVAGLGYFIFLFGRGTRGIKLADGTPLVFPADFIAALPTLVAIVLLLLLAWDWLFHLDDARLGFSETEIAFLFPAPISRTTLIQYNILRAQPRLLLSAAVFGVLGRSMATMAGIGLFQFIASLWLLFAVFQLHNIAASFACARLGVKPWMRRVLVLLVAVPYAWLCVHSVLGVPVRADAALYEQFAQWVIALGNSAWLSWLLLPLRWVVAPLFARGFGGFVLAAMQALLVLALHYFVAVRAQVAFEEGSIAHAAKRAARLAAARNGRLGVARIKPRVEPFKLATQGQPALAFLWKGLIAMGPLFRPRNFLLLCVVIVMASQWLFPQPLGHANWAIIGLIFAMLGQWFVLMTPIISAQTSLARSFERMDVLKSTPLHGWQIALGELATPTLVLVACEWLLLLVGAMALRTMGATAHASGSDLQWLLANPRLSIVWIIGTAVVTPPLCMLMLSLPFAGMLYFPAWIIAPNNGADARQQNAQMAGPRMLFMLGYVLVLAACLLPVGALGLLVFLLLKWLASLTVALLGTAVFCSVLLVLEAWLAIAQLGYRIDQFDLSQEMR